MVIGVLNVKTPEFKMISPDNTTTIFEDPITDSLYKLIKASKKAITANSFIGSIIGWIFCKILDSFILLTKRRLKRN